MTVDLDVRFDAAPDVHVRDLDGELVLLDLARGDYFGLNESGARAWKLLESGKTLREVVDQLRADYDVADQDLIADLSALVTALEERALLVRAA